MSRRDEDDRSYLLGLRFDETLTFLALLAVAVLMIRLLVAALQ